MMEARNNTRFANRRFLLFTITGSNLSAAQCPGCFVMFLR